MTMNFIFKVMIFLLLAMGELWCWAELSQSSCPLICQTHGNWNLIIFLALTSKYKFLFIACPSLHSIYLIKILEILHISLCGFSSCTILFYKLTTHLKSLIENEEIPLKKKRSSQFLFSFFWLVLVSLPRIKTTENIF